MIGFMFGNWSMILWAAAGVSAFIVTWRLFGRTFALPVGAAGAALIIFLMGKKIERDNYQEKVQDILEKREKEYEKIDDRHTDAADVDQRLRDGSF